MIEAVTVQKTKAYWLDGLAGLGVPAGPVNTVSEAFADPQVQHRGMRITMPHAHSGSGTVDLIGNPVKMSETPVSYRLAPPVLGEHTDQVLEELLGMGAEQREALRQQGIIG
jgi:crotonobetainyl-CoA:carnitine CoA-transferase CaiB-like acyl-CoA transferase